MRCRLRLRSRSYWNFAVTLQFCITLLQNTRARDLPLDGTVWVQYLRIYLIHIISQQYYRLKIVLHPACMEMSRVIVNIWE